MSDLRWPTTLILTSVLLVTAVLTYHGSIDGQAAAGLLGGIVGAVTTGHYVKTTLNGQSSPPPGSTTTITTPERTTVTAPGESL